MKRKESTKSPDGLRLRRRPADEMAPQKQSPPATPEPPVVQEAQSPSRAVSGPTWASHQRYSPIIDIPDSPTRGHNAKNPTPSHTSSQSNSQTHRTELVVEDAEVEGV